MSAQGYPSDWFCDPKQAEKYTCAICLCIFKNVSELQCGHNFCEGCIMNWKEKKEQGEATCPTCVESLDVIQPSFGKRKKVFQLLTYCPRKDQGCDKKFQLQHRLAPEFDTLHHNPPCIYQDLPCTQCGEKIQLKDMTVHMQKLCRAREVTCETCEQKYVAYQEKLHQEKCPKVIISCEQKCGMTFAREEIPSHKQVCENEPVSCPYSQSGCSEVVIRKNLEEHKKDIQSHFLYLAQKFEKEIKILTSDLETQRNLVGELKEDLATEKKLRLELSAKVDAITSHEAVQKKHRQKTPDSKKAKKKEVKENEPFPMRGAVHSSRISSPSLSLPFAHREVQIKAKHSGKVMTIEKSDENDGADLIQEENQSLNAQKFIMNPIDGYDRLFNIVAKHSRKALIADESSEGVKQWKPIEMDVQRFLVTPVDEGSYYITNKSSKKRLEVSKASPESGARIVQGSDHGGDHQKWIIEMDGSPSPKISSPSSSPIGMPSAIGFGLSSLGALLTGPLFTHSSSSPALFESGPSIRSCLDAYVGKYVAFECKHSGKYLEIKNLDKGEKCPIVQFSGFKRPSQQWKVHQNSDRSFIFISRYAEKALGYEKRSISHPIVLMNPKTNMTFYARQHEHDEKAVSLLVQSQSKDQEWLAVDVDEASKHDDARVILWRLKNVPNQYFRVHLVID